MNRKERKQERKRATGTQLAIIAGVLFLVVLVLIKSPKSAQDSASVQNAVEMASPAAGTVAPAQPLPATMLLPEAQFDQLLAEGKPIFAFFHSNTCEQCRRMTEIVQQIYPEFSATVALVDVNVYDQRNENLLQRANIRVIPTLIFIDRAGQWQGYTGVMQADALREQLQAMAEE